MKDMRISTRLAAAFGAMVLLIVLLGGVTEWKLGSVDEAFHQVVDDRYAKVAKLNEAMDNVNHIARSMGNTVIMNDPNAIRAEMAAIMKSRAAAGALMEELDKTLYVPRAKELMAEVVRWRAKYVDVQDRFLAMVKAGNDEEARVLLLKEAKPVQDTYFEKIEALVAFEVALMNESSAHASSAIRDVEVVTAAGVVLAALAAVAMALLIIRSITGPIARAIDVSRAVARGDLTQRIEAEGRNEMAQLLAALKEMQGSLASVVNSVRGNAESVASASSQISQGNNDLSGRTEEQASALEQTSASMKQLAATVQQNAASAEQGNVLASDASNVAARGGEVVGQVVETMKGINESSRKISDIIGVIDGIAFQTNILALNAAVEAARAGEQGRGFAVVAGEVRTLAQRSADAAKEIKGLIGDSVQRVEQGSALVDQAGATMGEVVRAITSVNDIMARISRASSEQSAGVAQVGEAVTQMDRTTQQNAALVEQSAAAAESLKAQSRQLVDAVAVFKLA